MSGTQIILTQLLGGVEDMLRQIVREEVQAAIKASQTQKSYTQKEAAKVLNISEPTLIDLRKKGKIKAYESGRSVMYTEAAIKNYIDNGTL